MASDLYNVLSGLYQGLNLEKSTRKAEIRYLSSVLSTAFQPRLAGNTADLSGLVYGGSDVSIADGQITVLSAGQVKHSFTVFGQSFNGSDDVAITNGTNITVTNGEVSVTSADIAENATGVAIAGAVYTAIENAKDAANEELTAVSGILKGEIDDVDDKVDAISGKVDDAFVTDEVVIGTADGIAASGKKIGATDKTGFGANDELAVEAAVTGYVTDAINAVNEAQGNALTGVLSSDTIAVTAGTKNVTLDARYDGTTISSDANGLKSLLTLKKLGTAESGYAASYQLQNGSGTAVGDTINIPKDQFLSGASYDATTEKLVLTFAIKGEGDATIASTVDVPVADMVHEYQGSDAVDVTITTDGDSTISLKLDTSTTGTEVGTGKFLSVTSNGLLLSGVQEAIDAASTDATAGLTALSSALTNYLSGNAVANEFTAVDGRLDALETKTSATIATDSIVVGGATGYADGGATLGKTAKDVTNDTAAESATVMASEKTVEDSIMGLIGATSVTELNTFAHGDASTEGSLKYLKAQIDALNANFAAI